MMATNWTIYCFLVLVFQCTIYGASMTKNGESYNVIMALPYATKSHFGVFGSIADRLLKQGHKVTMITSLKLNKPGISTIYLDEVAAFHHKGSVNYFQTSELSKPSGKLGLFKQLTTVCNKTYESPEFLDLMNNITNTKTNNQIYDLVIVSATGSEYMLPLAHQMKIPSIYVSAIGTLPYISWSMNVPTAFSYIASFLHFTHPSWLLSFTNRLNDLMQNLGATFVMRWYTYSKYDEIIHEKFPEMPTLLQLQANTSFFISNTVTGLQPAQPLMPNMKFLGCIHCQTAKPLPKNLEDFMQSSGQNGVIYFSLGSFTKGESMPQDMLEKLMRVFGEIKQNVLFKYERGIEGLSKNVKLIKWAPQQDILAHPKVRLFITHAGGLSVMEAAFHGCPIIGFPLCQDQYGQMSYAVRAGFGEVLNWKTFTVEEMRETVLKILEDNRYKNNAMHLSRILKDYPQPPVERAVYWIEYVIRHKGAHHLKSKADKLNFCQYFLLDVITFTIVIVILIFVLTAFIVKQFLIYLRVYNI